ncbi:MAG: DNA repair protein RecN [Deltaproteobacteria bacterium]|nr:DNA repair protein RecN [Deltaproteobacteria bacterium]
MLVHLKIRDLAIIDTIEIDFPPGFTVITGETGAGKSIIIDALIVVLGGRVSSDLIRSGAKEAEVEAIFDISKQPLIRARLEQRDLIGDDPDSLLIRRVVSSKGKSKVLINSYLSTVATLSEIVRGLVDMSGQHEQLSLLDTERHLEILDAFGELDEIKANYSKAYNYLLNINKELDNLTKSSEENLKRADFLRFQIEEIERLNPKPGEDSEIDVERRRLSNAEKLHNGAMAAESLLYGEDGSAFDKLGKATAEVESLARIDDELTSMLEPLFAAKRNIEEVTRLLQRYGDRIEADPTRLEWLEDRANSLTHLMRKHGGSLEEVLNRRDAMENELTNLDNAEDRISTLEAEELLAKQQLEIIAQQLTKARIEVGIRFSKAVLAEVADMELNDAAFEVKITSLSLKDESVNNSKFGQNGVDAVEFLWSANKGEPTRPLVKIISGGELSRLMLAVKRVLAARDLVSLYVFDEVDTGLGGRAADAIGRKLQVVAFNHQAIAITHLAPIACRADYHLFASKEVHESRTVSKIVSVSEKERATEIARMIDGARITQATIDAAKAMLIRAKTNQQHNKFNSPSQII